MRAVPLTLLLSLGAAPLLAAALLGFVLSIVLGAIAPASESVALDPTATFAAGFLLPLVSGAASQLLPVWLRPGVQSAWHAGLRRSLGRYGGVRAILFLIGGTAAGLGWGYGLLLGAATLIWFLLQAALSLLQATLIQRGNQP